MFSADSLACIDRSGGGALSRPARCDGLVPGKTQFLLDAATILSSESLTMSPGTNSAAGKVIQTLRLL